MPSGETTLALLDRETRAFRAEALRAYEGSASMRRAELGIALDQLCISDKVCKRVIEAARAGFHALIEWQRTSHPSLRGLARSRPAW